MLDWDKIIITVDDEIVSGASGQVMLLASGIPGTAATIAVGTVTTLPAGSPATVENAGSSSAAVLKFGIPKGADGVGSWGSIEGDIADQEDLQEALDAKADGSDLSDKADIITPSLSGALVTIEDGAAAPVKSLAVDIEPIQDLHGYDAPWPAGGGKNIFNIDNISTGTFNGITVSKSDNTISYSGTAIDSGWKSTIAVLTLPDGTWHCHLEGDAYWLENYTSKGKDYTVTVSGGTPVMRLSLVNAVAGQSYSGTVSNIQIESGSSFTSYAPYSNICPISGWTGCNVLRTGKNLLPNLKYTQSSTMIALGQNQSISVKTIYLKPGTYTLSVSTNNVSVGLYYRKSVTGNTNYTMNASGNVGSFTVTEADYFSFWAYKSDGLSSDDVLSFQLELGSTATDYEPYSGTTLSIDWESEAGTVYGGTLDVTTGVLTVTDEQIASYNGETLPSTWISDRDAYASGTTPTTGAQVVYALATPLTYQLDSHQMETLMGINHIWSDAGDTHVTYRADTKLYIDTAVKQNETEDDMTADRNIASGAYFQIGATLYKATAAIATGETIIPGTNCVKTTIAEALNLLSA